MNTDVLGSYRPGSSPLHRLSPGVKLVALCAGGTLTLVFRSPVTASAALVIAVLLSVIAKIGARQVWRTITRFAVVAALIFAFQAWQSGWIGAYTVVGTLFALLLAASVFTATTRTDDLLEALTRALEPLRRFGVKPQQVALAFSLTIRTIPLMLQIAVETRDAARARGLDRKLRARLVPLLIRAIAHAQTTGEALTARGVSDELADEYGGERSAGSSQKR